VLAVICAIVRCTTLTRRQNERDSAHGECPPLIVKRPSLFETVANEFANGVRALASNARCSAVKNMRV